MRDNGHEEEVADYVVPVCVNGACGRGVKSGDGHGEPSHDLLVTEAYNEGVEEAAPFVEAEAVAEDLDAGAEEEGEEGGENE